MKLFSFFYMILLFVALTPGVLLTLPKKNTKLIYIAITHGIIFAIVWILYKKFLLPVINRTFNIEGLTELTEEEEEEVEEEDPNASNKKKKME